MKKALGIAVLVALMLAMLPSSAQASPQWCEDDPVFVIDDTQYTVTTRFDNARRTSSTVVAYALTVSEDASVSWYHAGPTTVASTVTIARRGHRDGGHLAVSVSGDPSFSILVTVISGGSTATKQGSSHGTHIRLSAED